MTALPDTFETVTYAVRTALNPVLFTMAGLVLVARRPQWIGSWLLLVGAIVTVAALVVRVLVYPFGDAEEWIWRIFQATEAVGFVATGVGVILIAWRSRKV